MFVIRAKGEKKGHIFFEYTDEIGGKKYMGCEKMKYATEFKTKEEANAIIAGHERGENFEVVPYRIAEREYYG